MSTLRRTIDRGDRGKRGDHGAVMLMAIGFVLLVGAIRIERVVHVVGGAIVALVFTAQHGAEAAGAARDFGLELEAIGQADQLQIRRFKRRKLLLKDRIRQIEDQLTPDIIA